MLDKEQLAEFREAYWGKKPCLFRGAIDVTGFPLTSQALTNLVENDLVESRLITGDFELIHGPFESAGDSQDHDSTHLPLDSMLMVQCLEQHLQIARDLLDQEFTFIPGWQVDDVMASLGDDAATCGAHFDKYDVFLVQHTGRKIWHLDDGGHREEDLAPAADIRLLREFEPAHTWIIEPGDVLYVPPGFGHHGICDGTSLTLSVGIRNPTMAELLADLSEFALLSLDENPTITNKLFIEESAIGDEAISQIHSAVADLLNTDMLQRWYGSFSTRLREPDLLEQYEGPALKAGLNLVAALPSRLAATGRLLFANGEVYELEDVDTSWAAELAANRQLRMPKNPSESGLACLKALVATGGLLVS